MNLFKHIFILLLPYTICLAANSTIQGYITDSKTGEALIGANIMLMDTNMGIASDLDGAYIISDVPIGSYTLLAMFIGYDNLEKIIRVEADQKYIINISLKPTAIEIQETKVTAEKRKEKITGAPASMEIISSREIKGKTTTNMGAYLKGLKGVDFTSSGINNYSISVRGFNSSFSTRLLTLSDGRVANIPALRVINYSTIPQSMDDVERIEIILGPATALYGANAHSGVVNIISKPPSQSEGFTMSISGSHDDREFRKINSRFSKKLSRTLSMKISGLYLHAYDWQFISEDEYKAHRYPWTYAPYYTEDKKDNNPSNFGGTLDTGPHGIQIQWEENNSGELVRIGNGEKNHEDWDGDGVAGEDWWNGYDDDGDGLIDEDYFTADGIDNDGDGFIDENIDDGAEYGYDGLDNDNNGYFDDEGGSGLIDSNIKAWGSKIENNILISGGRKDSIINGTINPFFISNNIPDNWDVKGTHRYNENKVILEFDVYTYDFGADGLPGNPFIDIPGDGKHQVGEKLHNFTFNDYLSDCGLDGICEYLTQPFDLNNDGIFDIEGTLNPDWLGPDADGTEGDGIWQPGDGWVDLNNNGQVDKPVQFIGDSWQASTSDEEYNDVWPLRNGYWDESESIYDDINENGKWDSNEPILTNGIAMDGFMGEPFIDQNGNGMYDESYEIISEVDGVTQIQTYNETFSDINGNSKYDGPTGEFDDIFDTGDGLYAFKGEEFEDLNNDGFWNEGESFIDINGDGLYNAPDFVDNYQFIADNNGDGIDDYPDFEIDNRKFEFRLDYDPNPDFNITYQSGFSWTKTQQVTGTGRYIADGFQYTFHQFRSRYKNWFSQIYMNETDAGNTRGYNLGNRIKDKSKNYAFQLQNNFENSSKNTKIVWGIDYFRTEPKTFGTILADGPNGYDNDGDDIYIKNDGIDNDNDGMIDDKICPDGKGEGLKYGRYWKCTEGIDEPDEFVDPTSNEYGVYFQSTTELFGTSRFELITAGRIDYHDILDEGALFAPKFGFIYKPDSRSSMRITYGKAHNTPNSITLFTDLFIGSFNLFNIYLRGNKDGTPYCRVGVECHGSPPYEVVEPGFYAEDNNTFYTLGEKLSGDRFITNYFEGYEERVQGSPYFFKTQAGGTDGSILAGDMLPIDTALYLIFVPELNGDGVLYSAKESINLPDVDPIGTEKIQTLEFGYKGFLGNRTHISFDYYVSYYEDFFSPPTIITPFVVERFTEKGNEVTVNNALDNIVGLMPINDIGTNPPYGTSWNGLDDDNDWELWADEFGWRDDKDGDGIEMDHGEWGGVLLTSGTWGGKSYEEGDIFHPYEVLINQSGYPSWKGTFETAIGGRWESVGVDELHSTAGLNEFEPVETGLLDSNGNPLISNQGNARNITDLVLSPMNYGEVWMQGFDIGMTHFLSENLMLDGNIAWYGTTKFYNELTKKNDPINAPEWKWNASMKWNTSFGDIILNYRHVNQFQWSDGIWSGMIGPYDILDLFYTYHITKNLDFNISALNVNNDLHKELVGGAVMGRQIVMRFTSTF